jgi:hypothetical protein
LVSKVSGRSIGLSRKYMAKASEIGNAAAVLSTVQV